MFLRSTKPRSRDSGQPESGRRILQLSTRQSTPFSSVSLVRHPYSPDCLHLSSLYASVCPGQEQGLNHSREVRPATGALEHTGSGTCWPLLIDLLPFRVWATSPGPRGPQIPAPSSTRESAKPLVTQPRIAPEPPQTFSNVRRLPGSLSSCWRPLHFWASKLRRIVCGNRGGHFF